MKKTRVHDVMTTPVFTVEEPTPFRRLVALLYANAIGGVPVLDPAGRPRGMVCHADLLCKLADPLAAATVPVLKRPRHRRQRCKSAAATAGELMTAPAITIAPAATVEEAAQVMRGHRIGRLPVTDPPGRLVGIVTPSDLLRVYLRPDDDIQAEIETDVLPDTRGVEACQLEVCSAGGVVTLLGHVERRSTAAELVTAARKVEGVAHVNDRITYTIDDHYPFSPMYR